MHIFFVTFVYASFVFSGASILATALFVLKDKPAQNLYSTVKRTYADVIFPYILITPFYIALSFNRFFRYQDYMGKMFIVLVTVFVITILFFAHKNYSKNKSFKRFFVRDEWPEIINRISLYIASFCITFLPLSLINIVLKSIDYPYIHIEFPSSSLYLFPSNFTFILTILTIVIGLGFFFVKMRSAYHLKKQNEEKGMFSLKHLLILWFISSSLLIPEVWLENQLFCCDFGQRSSIALEYGGEELHHIRLFHEGSP